MNVERAIKEIAVAELTEFVHLTENYIDAPLRR